VLEGQLAFGLEDLWWTSVRVLEFSDWSWCIAAAQLGVGSVYVRLMTEDALLAEAFKVVRAVISFTKEDDLASCCALNLVTVHTEAELEVALHYQEIHLEGRLVVSIPSGRRQLEHRVADWARQHMFKVEAGTLDHKRLGGLSDAHAVFLWLNPPRLQRPVFALSDKQGTLRDPVRFLEPSVKLTQWESVPRLKSRTRRKGITSGNKRRVTTRRGEQVWDPRIGHITTPVVKNEWVIAPTVYLGVEWIARPLTIKERGQVLDVREDWADTLIPRVLWPLSMERRQQDKYELRDKLPVRLASEFLVQSFAWWRGSSQPHSKAKLKSGVPQYHGVVTRLE